MTNEELLTTINRIHVDCYQLCKNAFSKYFNNSGNMDVFCHSDEEYGLFTKIREELTEPSDNPKQKYYRLLEPIVIPAKNDVPKIGYTYLYIRKPDPTPYGLYRGDVDFFTNENEYRALKQSLLDGTVIQGAKMYDRPGWDFIQLSNPAIGSVAYVSTKENVEWVRVKHD